MLQEVSEPLTLGCMRGGSIPSTPLTLFSDWLAASGHLFLLLSRLVGA